jgi:predicted acyltransferase
MDGPTIAIPSDSVDGFRSDDAPGASPPGSRRILAIDAVRGFDMFWIAGGGALLLSFVQLFGAPPAWLKDQLGHPEWVGFSAWDMIMPLFLFIVGAAMPFSFATRVARGATKKDLYVKVCIRAAILFVLGLAAQGNLLAYDLSKLHLFCNTLQAIACGYAIAAVVMLELRIIWQLLALVALLGGYWLLMMFVPFGGHPAGTLDPRANLALYIDEFVLGGFRDGTTYTWILSSLGFGATTLLGVFAGYVLRTDKEPKAKCIALIALGMVCLAIGWAWGFHESDYRFPIIKHIWTSTMVFWAGGWSYLLLALFYLCIDVIGWKRGAFFFVVIGANAIAVYMANSLFDFHRIGDIFVGGLVANLKEWTDGGAEDLGAFIRNVAAFATIWLLLLFLYAKRTFIRV